MLLLEGCLHLVYLGSLSESIVKQNVLNYDLLVAYPLLLLFAVIKVARRGGGGGVQHYCTTAAEYIEINFETRRLLCDTFSLQWIHRTKEKFWTKAEKERHSLTGSCKLLNMNGDFT